MTNIGNTASEEAEGCALFLLFIAGWLIWLTFPVIIWTGIAALLAFLFHLGVDDKTEPSIHPPRDWFFGMKQGLMVAMRNFFLCILTGLCIVCIAQIILRGILYFSSSSSADSIKENICLVQERLSFLGSIEKIYFMVTYAILMLVLLFWVNSPLISILKTVKKWVSKILVVMLVASSFVFGASSRLFDMEGEWVSDHKDEFKDAISTIDSERFIYISWAVASQAIADMSPEQIEDLGIFFRELQYSDKKKEIIELVTNRTSQANSEFFGSEARSSESNAEEKKREQSQPKNSVENEQWVENIREKLQSDDENLSFRELQKCKEEASRIEKILADGGIAISETLKMVLGDALPESAYPLVDKFSKTLVGVLSQKIVDAAVPKTVKSLAAAQMWLHLAVKQPNINTPFELNVRVAEYRNIESSSQAMEETIISYESSIKENEQRIAEQNARQNEINNQRMREMQRIYERGPGRGGFRPPPVRGR